MTNAEKFKEDFGHEPNTNCPFDVYCPQCKWNNDRANCIIKFWQSEYKGEPTIPLSVIEDIKAEIEKKIGENLDGEGIPNNYAYCYESVLEIIDKAVKEIEHEHSD